MQVGDVDEIEKHMCAAIASQVDLADPASLGPLRPVFEVVNTKGGFGGASEYSALDSLNIPVDHAWTEVDFVGASALDREVWRFHMVREGGVWKVCSLEPRPDAPLPPADIGTVRASKIAALAELEATTPEEVRRILLRRHDRWSRLVPSPDSLCPAENGEPAASWSVVATGTWPDKQPNGGYLTAVVEASHDLSQWRAYTFGDCDVRVTYP